LTQKQLLFKTLFIKSFPQTDIFVILSAYGRLLFSTKALPRQKESRFIGRLGYE